MTIGDQELSFHPASRDHQAITIPAHRLVAVVVEPRGARQHHERDEVYWRPYEPVKTSEATTPGSRLRPVD
ncbi:MAG: hypothetical protein JO362_23470 [Streptomycetaceae bacterium]|nr:hypothetical protein [Streptomycetaceae bacterium]